MNDRDRQLVEHMIRYCNEIKIAMKQFNSDKTIFMDNFLYFNSCTMSLLQIGELAGRISAELKDSSDIPWKKIRGMRNIFAHDYLSVDKERVWYTIENDIPKLFNELEKLLRDKYQEGDGAFEEPKYQNH